MKRTKQNVLEDISRDTFKLLIDEEGWIARDKHKDYGIDLEIETTENEEVTGKVIWVQLKATEKIKPDQETIPFSIETKHLKYYESCQLPVLIIHYIKSINTFYYLFAQNYIRENLSMEDPDWRKKKYKTIKFPLDSKIDDIKNLKSIADEGYFYIMEQQLNEKQKIERDTQAAHYWLNGIPKSDDEELKQRTLKALNYSLNNEYPSAIKGYEEILRVLTLSPTQKMSILLNLGNAYYSISQNEDALKNYQAMLNITKKVSEKEALEGKSAALGNIGLIYSDKGDLDNALKYLQDALKIEKEIGDKQGEANQLGNIGLIYSAKGDLDNALKYLKDALKIHKEIGYKQGEANQLGNIGLIYYDKGDLDNALKYLKDALKIHKEIGYKQGEASALGNIGLIYFDKGDLDNALKYLKDALKIHKEIGYKQGEALDLDAIGLVFDAKGKLNKALKYMKDALIIHKEIGHRWGEAESLGNIGLIYSHKGDLDNALKYLKEAINILDTYKLVYGRDIIQKAIDSITKKVSGGNS